jgi:ribosomal protein L16 Arg81 hydroxylase
MLSFTDLLAPISPEVFHADYDDQKPLYIPATEGTTKRELLDWPGLNNLLGQRSLWTPQTLKVVFNGEPISPSLYCVETDGKSGRVLRPSPSKLQILMSQGASVIADDVQDLTPPVRALCKGISRALAGHVGAHIYSSFQGIQAFGTHYDLHHVFAVQTEGEKTWRLYKNRAERPTTFPFDSPQVRRWLNESRGEVMTEVRMRPGDVLYLPRGWYHDAIATDGASLHVTFSITPLSGHDFFRLLETAALEDPAFRAWLRPAEEGGGGALKAQLEGLSQALTTLIAQDRLRDEIAMAQARLIPRGDEFELPGRIPLTFYERTALPAPPLEGPAARAMEWALSQPRILLEDMIAEFDFVPEADLRDAVASAERAGALRRI